MDWWTPKIVDFNQLYINVISYISAIFIHSRSDTWFLFTHSCEIGNSHIYAQICSFLFFHDERFVFKYIFWNVWDFYKIWKYGIFLPRLLLNIVFFFSYILYYNIEFVCGIRFSFFLVSEMLHIGFFLF